VAVALAGVVVAAIDKKSPASTLQQRLRSASRGLLGAAAATAPVLAALVPAAVQAAQQPGDLDIRSALLVYSEVGRVSAAEPVIELQRLFADERVLSGKLVLDTLTGASANGAVPSSEAQTFTRPSGDGSFEVAPGETPLDDTFRDTRFALSLGWAQPLSRSLDGSVGLNVSSEYDYLSVGLSGTLAYDFNQNNSRVSLGLGIAADTIAPEGGVPTAFTEAGYYRGSGAASKAETEDEEEDEFEDDDDRNSGPDEQKTTLDLLLGWTQVIDRRSLLQFNLSLSQSDGYLTDPFKLVSVVDPESGEPLRQLYENRPDSRLKTGAFVRYKRAMRERDVFDLSYRYMTDDWGLDSHTVDFRYRLQLGAGPGYLRPHLRVYQQSAVDFFRHYLVDGESVPTEVTADYRQGDMLATTLGLEYGRQYANHQWGVALEYYRQAGSEPGSKVGQLQQQELAPDVNAVMLRVNYDFGW